MNKNGKCVHLSFLSLFHAVFSFFSLKMRKFIFAFAERENEKEWKEEKYLHENLIKISLNKLSRCKKNSLDFMQFFYVGVF